MFRKETYQNGHQMEFYTIFLKSYTKEVRKVDIYLQNPGNIE